MGSCGTRVQDGRRISRNARWYTPLFLFIWRAKHPSSSSAANGLQQRAADVQGRCADSGLGWQDSTWHRREPLRAACRAPQVQFSHLFEILQIFKSMNYQLYRLFGSILDTLLYHILILNQDPLDQSKDLMVFLLRYFVMITALEHCSCARRVVHFCGILINWIETLLFSCQVLSCITTSAVIVWVAIVWWELLLMNAVFCITTVNIISIFYIIITTTV